MVVFAGQGDARRSMALLWRTSSAADTRHGPGPRPGLNVDMIVDAAIAVADADGMAALSMRAVGDRLGRTAMALYTYVPSKRELVDLMYDRALAEMPADQDQGRDWRAAVIVWADDFRRFLVRHPWMLQVSQARPVLGPHEYDMVETLVRILDRSGMAARELWRVVGALIHFVRGMAQTIAESRQAAAVTGVSDEDWWFARSPLFDEFAPDFEHRFPVISRLGTEQAFRMQDESVPYLEQEARETFQVGLEVLLDGIEATVQRQARGTDVSTP